MSELMYMSPSDEGELVNETIYVAEIAEWARTEFTAITITPDKVRKLLKMVKLDQYPEDQVPDEVVMVYERLSSDYEYAKELEQDREDDPEEEEYEPEAEEEEPEEEPEDVRLVKSANAITTNGFSELFDIGPNGTQCVPKGSVTMDDWVKAFSFGVLMESSSQWIVGDSVVALENGGHEDVVNQLCAKYKRSYSTISGYARACRSFPAEVRDGTLPFSVYREIGNASFGDETQKKRLELLDKAKEEKLSSSEVRNVVREEQGKNVDKPHPHRYLLLNVANYSNSERLTKVPNKLEPHHLLIDTAGGKWYDPACEEWINFLKGE
jgi:hypothetical protein